MSDHGDSPIDAPEPGTAEEALSAFEKVDRTVLTASEVSEILGSSRADALSGLQALEERGLVECWDAPGEDRWCLVDAETASDGDPPDGDWGGDWKSLREASWRIGMGEAGRL